MSSQATASGKGAITYQTLERLQSSVRSDVCFEHSRRNKAPSTLRTLKRLLTRMRSDVLFKVARFFICTMTIKTLVWSICFIYKIIIKITLKKLVSWNGLDKTYVSYENWLLQRNIRDWNVRLANTNLCRFSLVPHLP